MVRAVGVFPDIVLVILAPYIDTLVIIGAPAVAHTKFVGRGIVGVIDMGNAHGHPVATKSHITADPNQIAGIIVDISAACSACRGGGIIPVIFQTVVVAEIDGYHRQNVNAIFRRCKLGADVIVMVAFFFVLGQSDGQTRVDSGVPIPRQIRNVPGVITFVLNLDKVFHRRVDLRLGRPGYRLRCPVRQNLVQFYDIGTIGCHQLVHFKCRRHDHVRRT